MFICRISKILKHNATHKTLFLDLKMSAQPGQFVMVWIPGIDEIPMSLSHFGNEIAITVEKVGEATEALHNMKKGDKLGIRGPYGNGFKIVGKKALFVAGGVGIAPLLPLIKEYEGEKCVILGARNKNLLLFEDEIKKFANLYITTDDGSAGYRGFATDLAKKILMREKFDVVYTCGPEPMMKKVLDLCIKSKIPLQASLERYMKCGVGICDSCAIDGYHVCKDGPVFNESILMKLSDFGKWKRNEAGRKISIS